MTQESSKQIGNWGKWGLQDERGALNYITPEVVVKATRLVKKGKVYGLSIPLYQKKTPIFAEEDRNPFLLLMRVDGGDWAAGAKRPGGKMQSCDDYIAFFPHAGTHIDALCHVWFDDKLYNGFDGNTVRSTGARFLGAEKIVWIVTRGVLLDIAGFKGVDILPKDYVITPDDLEECAKSQGIKFEGGEVLLFRTGWMNQYSKDPAGWEKEQPGIGEATLPWIIEREICVIGSDNGTLEKWPAEDKNKVTPVHAELVRNRGVYVMEMVALDELAKDRAYEFLFVAAPLKIRGGTASPLNPLAIT